MNYSLTVTVIWQSFRKERGGKMQNKKKPSAPARAIGPNQTCRGKSYPQTPDLSSAERIKKHRESMPRQYRRVYDIAQGGHSLRAAINSQCCECMGFVFAEVKVCCSPQCPLFPYRPLRGVSYGVSGIGQGVVESTNGG